MKQNNLLEGEKLCKECGLCCQGVFHTYANINNDNDLKILKKANISTHFDQKNNIKYFLLPCPAFNGSCSIYPERPSVCPEHRCNLLSAVINNETILEDALSKTSKIKNILNDLIPKLKDLSKNNDSNNPKYLMELILFNLNDEESEIKFKKEKKKLLLDYGVFSFLKERYFYK